MINKYKISEFKKGQLVIFYRHKNKLLAWSALCSSKEYDVLEDIFGMARLSIKNEMYP